MKHKLILIVMFAFLTVLYSCNGKEAGASYVNKIGELPKGATISDFWFSGPGMDHCYLWKIDFENADNKTKYITNLKDYESCVDGLGKDTGLGDARFPNWFKRDIIKNLEGIRKRNINNTNVYVFYSANDNVVFVQWFDT